ncbi:MAG: DUF1425 domain-containing protein [Gammaproteobacteria bacterium]|nr:DUF1425 domain-containing protein [Gammaproteobacteria bacterium]
MRRMILRNFILTGVAALTLAACSSNTLDPHVTEVSKSGDISIVDMRSAVVNNLLVAQTTFHNDSSKAIIGFYRCQFYDPNKMAIGAVQIWQPVTIYPNEDQGVKCMANDVEATDFKVEFSADGNKVSVFKYK